MGMEDYRINTDIPTLHPFDSSFCRNRGQGRVDVGALCLSSSNSHLQTIHQVFGPKAFRVKNLVGTRLIASAPHWFASRWYLHEADTIKRVPTSPRKNDEPVFPAKREATRTGTRPPPIPASTPCPYRTRGNFSHYSPIWLVLCLAVALLLTACNNNNTNVVLPPTSTTSSTGGSSGASPTASIPKGIQLGPQPCPNVVKDPAHWDAIIPTQPNVSKVEGVTCGFLTGTPTLQALITVRYNDTGKTLDIYVYNNIESASPNQVFKLLSLYDGTATISLRNTVMTGEVDQNSSLNKGKSGASFTRDLFREFNTASFAPVSFPGIFPDMTRYQAELDQVQVNAGQDSWKLFPTQVAAHFATDPTLLNWTNVNASLASGGGSGDAEAVVNISDTTPATQTISLTIQRLEGNINGGIWEVVGVSASSASGLSITTPQSRDILTSPTTVTGTGSTGAGISNSVIILDHTYSDIGHSAIQGTTSSAAFSVTVPYISTFKTGMQDGIVALLATNIASKTVIAVVMIKELL